MGRTTGEGEEGSSTALDPGPGSREPMLNPLGEELTGKIKVKEDSEDRKEAVVPEGPDLHIKRLDLCFCKLWLYLLGQIITFPNSNMGNGPLN